LGVEPKKPPITFDFATQKRRVMGYHQTSRLEKTTLTGAQALSGRSFFEIPHQIKHALAEPKQGQKLVAT
jgi:hypothetical protein